MSINLFQQLEDKISNTLSMLEHLKIQLEEAHEKNHALQNEITILKNRQTQWEQSLSHMLRKLDFVDSPKTEKEDFEEQEPKDNFEESNIESFELEYENE